LRQGAIKSYDEFQSTVQDFEEFSEEKEKDVVSVKPTIQ